MIQAFLVKASVWLTFLGALADLMGKALLEFAKMNDTTDSVYDDVAELARQRADEHDPDKIGTDKAIEEYGRKFDVMMICACVIDILFVFGIYIALQHYGWTDIANVFIVMSYALSSYAGFYLLRCNRKSLSMVDNVMSVLKSAVEGDGIQTGESNEEAESSEDPEDKSKKEE